jgi:histidinol dehydrogenase
LSTKDRYYAQKLDLLLKQVRAETQDVADVVSNIIDDVRRNGDAALIALTKKIRLN